MNRPAPPAPCPRCRHACGCELTDPGCGHYGCWGRAAVDCPGTEYERARYEAQLRATRALAVTVARRTRRRGLRSARLFARDLTRTLSRA